MIQTTRIDPPGTESLPESLSGLTAQIDGLRDVGHDFWRRGWSLGTSSNYSVVVQRDPLELLVTASGKDKGRLHRHDFVRVDALGRPVTPEQPKSSAETLLHVVLAQQPGVAAVLHTHSVWGTLLSDLYFEQERLVISGYEMLKGLDGISTHEALVEIAVFENTQDIRRLAEDVRARLEDPNAPIQHGFLIRNHGMYTWSADLQSARRQVEILEFLFETVARRLALTPAGIQADNQSSTGV